MISKLGKDLQTFGEIGEKEEVVKESLTPGGVYRCEADSDQEIMSNTM